MNKFYILVILFLTIFSGCATKNEYNNIELKTLKEITPIKKSKKALGIAFGGGGVRGFTHLGVIKALEEEGIKADIITGTSAGSIAASFYASGMSYKEIEKVVLALDESDIGDFTLNGAGGMIQGKKLAQWINQTTNNINIENTPLKLGIAVTDLTNSQALLITKGNIGEAVQASSSIPGGFVPVLSNKSIIVDGGVLSLIPINFNRALGADIIIGVDVYCGKIKKPKENMFNIIYTTSRVQNCKISEYEIRNADFIIRPEYEPENYGNFDSKQKSIEVGYKETKKIIQKIKKRLDF